MSDRIHSSGELESWKTVLELAQFEQSAFRPESAIHDFTLKDPFEKPLEMAAQSGRLFSALILSTPGRT